LFGVKSNSNGVGADIWLDVNTDNGIQSLHHEIGGGSSPYAQSSLAADIGLGSGLDSGKSYVIPRLVIEWPSGVVQIRYNVAADRRATFFEWGVTSVGQNPTGVSKPTLLDNFPNPFNPMTTISYSLPNAGFTTLDIFDVRGHHIRSLVATGLPAGFHSVDWDGLDEDNRAVPSGVYIYRLVFGDSSQARRMVLLR
jgi:hypothetical protein